MKKLYIILIVVGAVIVVATPTIFLSVYFGVQNRINKTDVTISGIQVTNLTDDSLSGAVNFTIDEPSTVAATFRVLSFNVSYNDHLLGSGVITSEFSTQQANHTASFTLDISDEEYFSTTFIDDFIESVNITLELDVSIEFTGKLEKLPIKTINKSLDVGGLNGLPVTMNSFDLLDINDDEILLEIETAINNPSQVDLTISDLYSDIYYQDTLFGNITAADFDLITGQNNLTVQSWISAEESLLTDFLTNYLSGDSIVVDLDLNISLDNFDSESFKIQKELNNVQISSVDGPLVTVDVVIISLSVSLGSASYDINTELTIHNPIDFAINVTYFNGLLVYDDTDGVSFPPYGSYPSKNNITITLVTFDWSASPVMLGGSGEALEVFSFSDNDLEQGIRLYDEYYTDNSLYVSIINAEVSVQIDSFEITVPLEIYDIYVPND